MSEPEPDRTDDAEDAAHDDDAVGEAGAGTGADATSAATDAAHDDDADAAVADTRTDGATVDDGEAADDPTGPEPSFPHAAGDDALAPDAALVAAVDDAPEDAAAEIATLRETVGDLRARLDDREARIDELESRLRRSKADFENYKKRQERRREQLRERATESLVTDLFDVRDNLARALTAEGEIREGVESTLRLLDDVLEGEGVERIDPDPGTDVDPQRHEVLMRVDSDHPADTVADIHRPGYEMAEKVLRPAQVTVSDGAEDTGDADADGTDADA